MTGEVKEGSRRRWHQRSKSSIGDLIATESKDVKPIIEPKDVFHKTLSTRGKVTGRDHSRSWFKSKKAQPKESDPSKYPETIDLEVEEKPMQRVVQGLYRDDDGGPSPKILDTSNSAVREAIREFSKDFLALLKANPDECAAMEAQMRQHLSLAADPPHTDLKFLVQAYITHHFFSDFENASFGISNPGEKPWEVQQHMLSCFEQFQKYKTKTQTMSKLLENELNDTFLSNFCMKKFRTLVPLDAEGSFFEGDSQQHLSLEKGIHPNTPFYKSFLSAAVSMWLLQRLACSFEQKIVPIYPTRGDAFQRRFMQPVVPGTGDAEDEEGDIDLEIVFTVFPGFRVSESILESLVYIVENPKTEDPASTTVENEAADIGQNPSMELEDRASSSVDNGAAEVGQSASKESLFQKFSASISAIRSENSEIRGPQKSSSLKDTSRRKDEDANLLKKIINKITRKKSPAKDKAGDDASTTTEASALPSLEEDPPALSSSSEVPTALGAPSSDAEQDTPAANLSVPGESSPLKPSNLEVVESSFEPDVSNLAPITSIREERLYIPRAEKAMLMSSPLTPRLSSVD